MKKIILYACWCMFTVTATFASQPVCLASEYAKMVCQTVNINGKPAQECRWVCLPLSGAGR